MQRMLQKLLREKPEQFVAQLGELERAHAAGAMRPETADPHASDPAGDKPAIAAPSASTANAGQRMEGMTDDKRKEKVSEGVKVATTPAAVPALSQVIEQRSAEKAAPGSDPQKVATIKERDADMQTRIAELRTRTLKRSKVTVAQSGILTKFVPGQKLHQLRANQ